MKIVDAMGDACPLPVIKTKKMLKTSQEGVKVLVDNEIATQNLSKMAQQLGLSVRVVSLSKTAYEVYINEEEHAPKATFKPISEKSGDYVVVIDRQTMGQGDERLGKTLMKSFIYAYTEQDILPKYILFYNSGAYLSVEESAVLEDLQLLVSKGVTILTCGACLDFYQLTEKLAVGEITNMYRIVEIMSGYRVVKP